MEKHVTSLLEIHCTEKALRFIRTAKMQNPQILVNLEYYRPVSGGCYGRGMSDPIPTAKVRLVDNRTPAEGFMRVESREGIPVHIAKPAYESAIRSGNPLIVVLAASLEER